MFSSDRYHRTFLDIGDYSTKIDFILRENKVEKYRKNNFKRGGLSHRRGSLKRRYHDA